MGHRTKQRLVSCLAATVLLFAQALAIAQACVTPDATPAMAFADDIASQDCHDAVLANPQPNPNSCLQHCNAGDQTTAQVPADVPAMPEVAVLIVQVLAETAPVFARAETCELHSPDPPPSLRFCSFQL
jgi:hypothetical protein